MRVLPEVLQALPAVQAGVQELPGVRAEAPVEALQAQQELQVLPLQYFHSRQVFDRMNKFRIPEAVFHITDKMPFHYLQFSLSGPDDYGQSVPFSSTACIIAYY